MDSKAEVFRQAEARFERTEPYRAGLCANCGHPSTDHEADGLLCKGDRRYVLGTGRCDCAHYEYR